MFSRLRKLLRAYDRFFLLRWPAAWETHAHHIVPIGVPALFAIFGLDWLLFPIGRNNVPEFALQAIIAYGVGGLFLFSCFGVSATGAIRRRGIVPGAKGWPRLVAGLACGLVALFLPWMHLWGLEAGARARIPPHVAMDDYLKIEFARFALNHFPFEDGSRNTDLPGVSYRRLTKRGWQEACERYPKLSHLPAPDRKDTLSLTLISARLPASKWIDISENSFQVTLIETKQEFRITSDPTITAAARKKLRGMAAISWQYQPEKGVESGKNVESRDDRDPIRDADTNLASLLEFYGLSQANEAEVRETWGFLLWWPTIVLIVVFAGSFIHVPATEGLAVSAGLAGLTVGVALLGGWVGRLEMTGPYFAGFWLVSCFAWALLAWCSAALGKWQWLTKGASFFVVVALPTLPLVALTSAQVPLPGSDLSWTSWVRSLEAQWELGVLAVTSVLALLCLQTVAARVHALPRG